MTLLYFGFEHLEFVLGIGVYLAGRQLSEYIPGSDFWDYYPSIRYTRFSPISPADVRVMIGETPLVTAPARGLIVVGEL